MADDDTPANDTPGDDKVVELRPGKPRKRLSSIDALPADVRAELNAAIEEKRLTVDELWELVRDKGGDVSRSAVGRHKVREEQHQAVFQKSMRMAEYFARERAKDPTGPASIVNNEIVKSLVFQRMMAMSPRDAEKVDPKDLSLLAAAVRAGASTDKITLEREEMIAKRAVEKERQRAAKAVEGVAKQRGLTKEAVAEIRQKILGVAG